MTRIVLALATAALAAACAPAVVEQPADAAFPGIFEARPIGVVVIDQPIEPIEAAAPARRTPPRTSGPLPAAPEGAGEGLPPTGQAVCSGVGIEANC